MTLRDFLNSVQNASDEMLDAPIIIRLDTAQSCYTGKASALGSYTQDVFIGPSGIMDETLLKDNFSEPDQDPDAETIADYDLLIPKHHLVIDMEPFGPPVIDVVQPSYIPHLKMERE